MKMIRVFGTKPKSHPFPVISWLIRLFEWSSISHVGIYFPEEEAVFNAHFNSIKMEDFEEYKSKHQIVYEVALPLTNKEYQELKEAAEAKLGKQRGYYQTLIGIIPSQIARLFGFYINHPFPKGYTCSWIVHEVLTGIDFKFDERIDPPNFTTRDTIEGCIDAIDQLPKSRLKYLE